MKFCLLILLFILGCSTSATDVPESSHIENTDVVNYRNEIASHQTEIRRCFRGHFKEDEMINLTIALIIAPNGEVTKKTFNANKQLNSSIYNCLNFVVDDMDFSPPQRKGTIEITYVSKIKISIH